MVIDFFVEIQSFELVDKELMVLREEGMRWTFNSNGVLNRDRVGIRVVLESSFGVIIREAFQLEKQMTNNEAEYEALLYGLELALKLEVQNLKVFLDSELVLGHVNRVFKMKDKRMKAYYNKVT